MCRATRPSGGAGLIRPAYAARIGRRKLFPFFGDLLHAQVRAFNPKYKEAEGALVGEFQRLTPTSTAIAIF